MTKYFVYMIESEEGYRYTGMTENLAFRPAQHNNHELSFHTKRGTNWKILHFEEFSIKSDALKRERWLKTGVGRDFIRNLLVK